MGLRILAIVTAVLCYAATAFAADVPTNIGGTDVPAGASASLLAKLGFTDLQRKPDVRGDLLYTSGKWEEREIEIKVNLKSGNIDVVKLGPPPPSPATDCLDLTAKLDFEQAAVGEALHKCLVLLEPEPETAGAQCLELSAGLSFEDAGSGKLLRDCLLQKVGS